MTPFYQQFAPITSIASDHMSRLLIWRNPDGVEENWKEGKSIPDPHLFLGRVIVTELNLLILATVAVVETVAYSVFSLFALLYVPYSPEPFKHSFALLRSSSFTIGWALVNLVFNITCKNLFTCEPYARSVALSWLPLHTTPLNDVFSMVSKEDFEYISGRTCYARIYHPDQEIIHKSAYASICERGKRIITGYDVGAIFLAEHILNQTPKEEIDLTNELDEIVRLFIISKAIFSISTYYQEPPLSEFFNEKAAPKIKALRQSSQELQFVKIGYMMANLKSFQEEPKAEHKLAFNRIKRDAANLINESPLLGVRWLRALEFIHYPQELTSAKRRFPLL